MTSTSLWTQHTRDRGCRLPRVIQHVRERDDVWQPLSSQSLVPELLGQLFADLNTLWADEIARNFDTVGAIQYLQEFRNHVADYRKSYLMGATGRDKYSMTEILPDYVGVHRELCTQFF